MRMMRVSKRNLENEKYLENARVNMPPIRMPLKMLNDNIQKPCLTLKNGALAGIAL
jgi:hypothetical protein